MRRVNAFWKTSSLLVVSACDGSGGLRAEHSLDANVSGDDASPIDSGVFDAGVDGAAGDAALCQAGQHAEVSGCVPDNECPYGCSGHGTCGVDGVCTCDMGYASMGCQDCAANFERGSDDQCLNVACGNCESPMVCAPQSGACCLDQCTGGDSECSAGLERRCIAGAGGCPVWSSWFSCGTGGCADDSRCTPPAAGVSVDQFGTVSHDVVLGISRGKPGEVLVSGLTWGRMGERLAGEADGFLASRNENRISNWLRQFGTTTEDRAPGLVRLSSGELVVGGEAGGSLETGEAGSPDGFMIKFSASGTQTKVTRYGSSAQERVYNFAQGLDGNFYAAGFTFGGVDGPSAGDQDCFVTKLSPAGDIAWSMQFGVVESDVCENVTADAAGNVYAVGFTEGDLAGSGYVGNRDAFLAKVDANGNVAWIRTWGTPLEDGGSAVKVGSDGGIYVLGVANGDLGRSGMGSAFLAKFDPLGDEQWIEQWGGSSTFGRALAFDANGALYVAGSTRDSLDSQPSAGGSDAFVCKWTFGVGGTRARVWTRQFGTAGDDPVYALSLDEAGILHLGGSTTGSFPGYKNTGLADAFLARLAAP